jgi:hypothetical protein
LPVSTAQDIITDAYGKLGVYAPGETLDDADAAQGLLTLNNMIDQWSGDSLYVYQLTNPNVSLVNGVASYSIGLGGVFNVARPLRVVTGPGSGSVTSGGTTTALNVVSRLEWNQIYNAGPPGPGAGVPNTMFYDQMYPLGNLNFAPTPNGSAVAAFSAWSGLTNFATLNTNAVLAPGADEALKTNLAVMLKAYFLDGVVTPDLLAAAQQTKTTLQYTNRLSRALSRRNQASSAQIAPRP